MISVSTLAAAAFLAAALDTPAARSTDTGTDTGALLDELEVCLAEGTDGAEEREAVLVAALVEVGIEPLRSLLHERARGPGADHARQRAVLRLLGEIGTHGELDLAILAANPTVVGERCDPAVCSALEHAVEGILVRHPEAHPVAGRLVTSADGGVATGLIRALARTGVRGQSELGGLLGKTPDLDTVVLSELSRSVESALAPPPPGLAAEVRPYLFVSDSQLLREASGLVGRLVDFDSTDRLIALLQHESPAARDGAERGLAALTGLSWGSDEARWRTWLEGERLWYERRGPELFSDLEGRNGARILGALNELGGHRFHRDATSRKVAGALSHPSPEVRAAACGALARLGWVGSLDPLIEHFSVEAEGTVLAAMNRALVALSGREATESSAHAWREALAKPAR